MNCQDKYKVELVQVLFRHGARTYNQLEAALAMPEYIDQNLLDTYDYQQLTNVGKTQAYNLGLALRERYHDYLGDTYRPREVYAYSSDFDRTKTSLQLVLAGLYPPPTEQLWNPDLKWMPIPFHYAPQELDVLLQTFRKSAYQAHLKNACQSKIGKEHESKIMDMHESFFKEKGIHSLQKHKFHGVIGVYNVLSILRAADCPLPSWYTEELFETMKDRVVDYLDLMSLTTEMKKRNCGPLLKKWVENMNLDETAKNPTKIYLYSGHELNLAAVTRSHNAQDQFKYPDYSSALVLEKLRDSENKLFVRLLVWTGKDGKFTPLRLGKFEEFCPVEEYLKLIEPIIPTNDEVNSILRDAEEDFKELLDSVSKSKHIVNRANPF